MVGGACFILPAMAIVLALAWAYVEYGTTTIGRGLLYGITPVVIGIVAAAVLGLGRIAIKSVRLAVLAGFVVVGYFLDVNVLLLLLGSGAIEMVARNAGRLRPGGTSAIGLVFLATVGTNASARASANGSGALAGRGVPRVPEARCGRVRQRLRAVRIPPARSRRQSRWLSTRQLVDAISIGQITPGPVFTTATFVGYLVAGFWGGVVATLGIFLPSFLLVAAFGWLVPVLRRSPWSGAALDGINTAAVGLMAGVTWDLGGTAIVDPLTAVLAGPRSWSCCAGGRTSPG